MSAPKIAYVTGQYPLVSLTFIQREIAALRDLGLEVLTCSMRRTAPDQHRGPAEKEAAKSTFYVLERLRQPLTLMAAQQSLFKGFRRYFLALKLAWSMRSPGLKAALYQLVYFLEATVLARHLVSEGATHIHAHFTAGATTVAMLASELTGIPYSFTLHGPADFLDPYRWKIGEKAARARFVATISHYARSQLMFHTPPEHWEKLHIVHCGVDPARYGKENRRSEKEIRLIFVGRFAPVKGLRLLVEAVSRLAQDLPGLTLTLVGDGEDRDTIEALAAPLGDRVRFTGYLAQDDVAGELCAAHIAVLPSFAEGVPVFLMEALASETPVIATQVAGVGELVEPGLNGLLVAPGDVDALTDAIRQLAGDATRRSAMGTHGRARVAEDFDIRTEAARLAWLFTQGGAPDIRPPVHRGPIPGRHDKSGSVG